MTEEEQREFVIKDNVGFGEWNFDVLANEWDDVELVEWGMNLPQPDDTEEGKKDLSDKVVEKYAVEIDCSNEGEQEEIYNELVERGYVCRVLTL